MPPPLPVQHAARHQRPRPDPAGPGPARPGLPARRGLRLLALLLIATAVLGGCARVRVALALQPDDTVKGELVLATPEKSAEDKGQQVDVPPDLAGMVDVSAYRQDGYAGSVLRFSGLSFEQVGRLTEAAGPAGEKVRFTLRRAGNRVSIGGAVDLTTVSVDRADFQLKISFSGRVVETNGEAEGGTVSWRFTPGEVGDVRAVVAFADPGAPSVLNWTLGLATVMMIVAAAVVLAARRTRNPPVGPPVR